MISSVEQMSTVVVEMLVRAVSSMILLSMEMELKETVLLQDVHGFKEILVDLSAERNSSFAL